MQHRAKLFANGRSQAVRLPAAFRFDGDEVFIRRDEATGDVILSRKPNDWDDFLALIGKDAVPVDFLDAKERDQGGQDRDPLHAWRE
jgi:antitoxin VapB